jgi:aminoglycoside 3-N-acetyltransferase
MDYTELVDTFDIKSGETLHISSDITTFGFKMLQKYGRYDPNKLIDTILDRLGSGTLLLPVYNWDFCKGKVFDYKKTVGRTGVLGKTALARNDFKRTRHPIYSFAVYGKDIDYLCGLNNINSFGGDSPFHYMYEKHAKQIGIDVVWEHFFTFTHYVEECSGYPFRFMKYFESDYIDEHGNKDKRKYSMYVKHLEITSDGYHSAYHEMMLKHNTAKEIVIDDINIKIIDLHSSFPVIANCFLTDEICSCKYFQDRYVMPIDTILTELSSVYSKFDYLAKHIPELNTVTGSAYIAGRTYTKEVFWAEKVSDMVAAVDVIRYIKSFKNRQNNYEIHFGQKPSEPHRLIIFSDLEKVKQCIFELEGK